MIIQNNLGAPDSYNDQNQWISLQAGVITLQVFANAALIFRVFKPTPEGVGYIDSQDFEFQTAGGAITIINGCGIKVKNAIPGQVARFFLQISDRGEYEPNPESKGWPDPVISGFVPITQQISASGGVSTAGIPAGFVIFDAGSVAPTGFVAADGATYDGTQAQFLNLWNRIGITYGGTGQSAFKVPNVQGRMIVGLGTNANVNTLGQNEGQATDNLRRPHHRTSFSDPTHGHTTYGDTGVGGANTYAGLLRATAALVMPITANPTNIIIGTNNGNDPLDTPCFIVLKPLVSLG